MARPATGKIRMNVRKDGSTFFSARVWAHGSRHTIKFGTDREGWTRKRVEAKLADIQTLIRLGLWEPPADLPPEQGPEPTFHEVASNWLAMRAAEGLAERTLEDYRWRLVRHLPPFFAEYPLSGIDVRCVERFKPEKLQEREEILAARAAGTPLQEARGSARRPLSNKSINNLLELLAQILDDASETLLATTGARTGAIPPVAVDGD